MGSIKEELLLKAKIDKSKLVQVQRTVSRGGKTFVQNFWIKPSEVKSTDKVVGGQSVLTAYNNQQSATASASQPASGVLDSLWFDHLAQTDKSKALEYLKSCGVTWKEHSHAGINWMRAKQALSLALGNSTQVNTQVQPKNQIPAQNSQSVSSSSTFDKLSSNQQQLNSELKDCKNGREKVVVMKKIVGVDGCEYFAEQLGITWDKNAHAAINWMRLSSALQQYFDAKDGTVSPKNTSSAKKNTTNSDELPTPKDATQRKQNIIKILNSITSESDLESFISVGMLPEDDVSKSFILDKLAPKYAIFAAANLKSSSSSSKNRSNRNTYSGFADQVSHDLNYEGCAKKVVGYGLQQLYTEFNMAMLTDPRSQMATLVGDYDSRRNKVNTTFGIMTDLNDAFAYYTTDKYAEDNNGVMRGKYMTNKGYTGYDPDEYEERYDYEKEGFVRAMRIIQEKYPQLESKCNEMADTYDEMMRICKGNPQLLDSVLSQDSWTDADIDGKPETWNFGWLNNNKRVKPQNARETLRVINLQYKAVLQVVKDKGMSDESIARTLRDTYWNDDLSNFVLRDDNGNAIETVNIIDLAKDSSGMPILNDDNSQRCSRRFLSYMHAKYITDNSIDSWYDEDALQSYKYYQQVANFTEEDYLQVQDKFHKLFGYQFTKTDLNTGIEEVVDITKVDTSRFGEVLGDCKSVAIYDKDKDYVLSNLFMMSMEKRIHQHIIDNVYENPSSNLNKRGNDYSGNYSFYYPTHDQEHNELRTTQRGNSRFGIPVFSLDTLNSKINEQLEAMVTYSPDYIDHLSEFYNAKSSYQNATGEAKKANMWSVGINVHDYVDDPLKDILYNYTTAIAHNIPKMSEKGIDKLDALMAKRMDYVPYDFKSPKQKRLSDSKPSSSSSNTTKSNLRNLREQALKAVNCTISVEDEKTSLQMRKDFLYNWDYRDGKTERTPDGITKSGRMYSGSSSWGGHDRRALFNSRFFRVNNSNMEEDYNKYKTDLQTNHNYSTHFLGQTVNYKPADELELYHACSYAGAAGILGKTGGWFMGNEYTKTAKALGNGAYFGFKGAKSSVYCGEGSGGYHNTSASGASGDNANGCYILATVMRGKPGDSQSDNGRFRDYEIAVKTNKCIKPHHFVDISARCMDVNIRRDNKGNYLDWNTGKITHDHYGQAIDMK